MKKFKKLIMVLMSSLLVLSLVSCGSKTESGDEVLEKPAERPAELPVVTIKVKNFGVIEAELYPDKAPNTVNNFIYLANSGYYDGLIFHRVIKGFMNQGGDPLGNGTGGPGYTIKGEFSSNGYNYNDLKHTKGVLSMARSNKPDTAGSQFFIMAEDASHLDGKYAAFGMVTKGLDVVEAINSVETDSSDKPKNDVVIEEIRVDTKGVEYPEPERSK